MTSPESTLRYGKVVYRVLAGIGDGPDANVLPDGLPVTGVGTLTPRVERIVDRGVGFPSTTVLPRPVKVSFVNGYLTYRGDPWVWLLASEAGVWRWHASMTYRVGSDTISDEFLFDLPPGDPTDPNYRGVDLTLARVIVTPDTGIPTVVGPPGRSVQTVVLRPDGLLFVMSQGDDIDVTIPYLGQLSTAAQDAAASAATAITQAQTATEQAQAATAAAQAADASKAAAKTSETASAGSATSASGSAASAEQSAISAAGSASTASTKAAQAVASADAATEAAQDAATKADEAAASAAAAAASAQEAANVIIDSIPDATATQKGGIRLAGDLAGTYAAPTVPGLAQRAPLVHGHTIADVDGLDAALDAREEVSRKGQPDGYAPLDSSGKVPAANLPSYVDDVLEYADLGAFPATGEPAKLYMALDSNLLYRWSGSAYAEVSQSLALGTTGSTAAAGNDPRLSDTRTPTPGSVTNASVAANAAIALSKLAAGHVKGVLANGTPTTLTVWIGTEAQFTALPTKDSNTIYLRTEEAA
ncbi:Uncharacterised protein [Mycobacteroides abscessus subsp. abscessus]|nr:Uncharacterised protein [Mycobacteroides abscessus subsp. abscessus]